jgi:AcrR family transcriptional regulator
MPPSPAESATTDDHRSAVAERPPDDRRDHILRAAARLFAEQGYLGTSTTQIAKAVGIRQPTLYHHFRSKAEILRELLADWLGAVPEVAEDLAGWRDVDAAPRLYALLRSDLETLGR